MLALPLVDDRGIDGLPEAAGGEALNDGALVGPVSIIVTYSPGFLTGFAEPVVVETLNVLAPAGPVSVSVVDTQGYSARSSHDANGNTTGSNLGTDVYNFENRLVRRTNAGGQVITITYDGDGNKVSEAQGMVSTNFLIDTNNSTGYVQVAEETANGSLSKVYVYGMQRIAQRGPTGAVTIYGYDGHGNVRQLFDASGIITDFYTYDAFGVLISSMGNTTNRYLYCGEQYVPGLAMYYNRARYLEPGRGRFWNMDTWEGSPNDPPSLHKYNYCQQNPINHIDASGHSVGLIISIVVIGLVAIALLDIASVLLENVSKRITPQIQPLYPAPTISPPLDAPMLDAAYKEHDVLVAATAPGDTAAQAEAWQIAQYDAAAMEDVLNETGEGLMYPGGDLGDVENSWSRIPYNPLTYGDNGYGCIPCRRAELDTIQSLKLKGWYVTWNSGWHPFRHEWVVLFNIKTGKAVQSLSWKYGWPVMVPGSEQGPLTTSPQYGGGP